MDVATGLAAGKTLLEIAQQISNLIAKAKDNQQVERRVVYYLEAVQGAVQALGIERQQVLTDARHCDVTDEEQVEALWQRLDRYLFEDNIRPELQKAIDGLRGCREEIEKKAQGLRWRKRDKQKALKIFTSTQFELESLLDGLTSNFYPGGSGMGVQTLRPIYEMSKRVHDDRRLGNPQDADSQELSEELSGLVLDALSDNSHQEWFLMNGKIETLIAKLLLVFSVETTEVNKTEVPG